MNKEAGEGCNTTKKAGLRLFQIGMHFSTLLEVQKFQPGIVLVDYTISGILAIRCQLL
jgi:hypothetical protein